MRAVITRVTSASVSTAGHVVSEIGHGLLVLIGVQNGDESAADKYDKQFFETLGPDPDRYGNLRASPCFAIYQARPAGELKAGR